MNRANVFVVLKRTNTSQLCVRDLRPLDVIPVGKSKMATVSSLTVLNGKNGEPPRMIAGGRPSAIAIRIEFFDHDPIVAHPGDIVTTRPAVKQLH